VVTEQVEYFRRSGGSVEWKVFGHDQPGNLETILSAAGFVPDPPETLIAFDLREGLPEGMVTVGIDFRRVTDDAGIHDAVAANVAAFGPEAQDRAMAYEQRLRAPNQAVVVAYAEGAPIASGRVDLPPGRSFAGLWGGGTAPAYRHRGVYRGLVHERAVLARNAGYHYLTADALETSRPILERLGFVPLTTTRGWILEAGPGPSAGELSPKDTEFVWESQPRRQWVHLRDFRPRWIADYMVLLLSVCGLRIHLSAPAAHDDNRSRPLPID